ncbi:MAG: hypothetical protein NTX28_07730 [Novosphingobium sp.]|nr:hypothetical protein [Novosphingobium sp.]
MIRIKLFGLFIAFALLALVRPRKCLELLEAADAGADAQADKDLIERQNALVQRAPSDEYELFAETYRRLADEKHGPGSEGMATFHSERHWKGWPGEMWRARAKLAQECPLPPAGWRCTRRAGHDGPCAAVVK